ncbi:MAG: molybdopterin-dependent oxidoreductase [Desulfobaccales bacterium]
MEEKRQATCQWCKGRCQVLAHVKDQRLLRLTLDHSLGERCSGAQRAKCYRRAAAVEWLYHPNRLKFPLKRSGPRGAGTWETVSWEQALDEIAERLSAIGKQYQPEAVGLLSGDNWAQFEYGTRFMNLWGSPNYAGPSPICMGPRVNVARAVIGWYPAFSITPATRCIVLLGCNTFVSRPIVYEASKKAIQEGAKIIAIDPRRTETSAGADLWLQLRPGTDAFLLMAMIRIIIKENLYNHDFVTRWCYGFNELKARVEQCKPEEAEKVTWVPAQLIREAARLYATTKPAAFVEGMGVEQQANAVSAIHARWILAALTGNIDVKGGEELPGPHPFYISDREMELTDLLPAAQKDKQIGTDRYKFHGWPLQTELEELTYRTWGSRAEPPVWYLGQGHAPSLYQAILTGRPYPIRALFSVGSNPMVSHANTRRVYDALQELDLFVVMDTFRTPSGALADYVLPAASWLEKPQAYSYLGLGRTLTASSAIMPAVLPGKYERRDEYGFWRGLGIRLGQVEHWTWESSEEMLDYRFQALGVKFEKFARNKIKETLNPPQYRQYEKIGFATPTRKVELYSTLLKKLGYDPLPKYQEEPITPVSQPELSKEFPLIMINGARRMEYMHTDWRQVSVIRKQYPFPVVEVHPETCRKLGISEGQWVWIETRRGRVMQKCKVFAGIDPRVVHADFDWWYPEMPESEPSLFGVWLSNINVLTEDGDDVCGAEMGTWSLRFNLCRIYLVKPEEIPKELGGEVPKQGGAQ